MALVMMRVLGTCGYEGIRGDTKSYKYMRRENGSETFDRDWKREHKIPGCFFRNMKNRLLGF